jgi:hypothetical protein
MAKPGSIQSMRPEEVVWQGKPSLVQLIPVAFWCLLLSWLIVPIFYLLWRYLELTNTAYVLTTQRILTKTGVFGKKRNELDLVRIQDYTMERRFFYQVIDVLRKLLGKKDLLLEDICITPTDVRPKLILESILKAEWVKEQIRINTLEEKINKKTIYPG